MPPEEVLKKELSYEETIRKDERQKVYEEIIKFCEERKSKFMNLSIPIRDMPISELNKVIAYCCTNETDEIEC
jgi:hypothetical protein